MKNSATTNKNQEATKIVPGTSADKKNQDNKNLASTNAKNIKGKVGSPVQQVEELIPPPPKESNYFNL